jgi:hypothetical protein
MRDGKVVDATAFYDSISFSNRRVSPADLYSKACAQTSASPGALTLTDSHRLH